MSSILRSSKFVRYFVGLARNIVLNTPRDVDGSIVQRGQCLATTVKNNYATAYAQNKTSSLDKSIKKLDEDARRVGRISRKEIEEVLDEIRQSKRATSSQSLMVLRCCGNLVPEEAPELRTQLVKQVWNTLEKLGVPMDISHYNALLRVYLENEHRFSPTKFLSELEAKGVEPNRVTYQRLIAGFCQEGDISGATRILEHMREKQLPVSESVFNALILGHSQADDLESAHGILGVMRQAGLEPSNETYTTLMCGYAKKGDIESINKLFEECETKDVLLLDRDVLEVVYALGINKHTDLVDKVLPRVKYLLGYNQDAANVILRLITKQDDVTAMKVFRTMKTPSRLNGQPVYVGSFLIKQMVKANTPLERITAVCSQLKQEGLNTLSFLIAMQATFSVNNVQQTLDIMQALIDNNETPRIHYFWPVLIASGRAGNFQDVKTVLSAMNNQFNMPPNTETLRDYVLPYMSKLTPEKMLSILMESGLKRGTAASAVIGYLVNNNRLSEAATITLQNTDINFLLSFRPISLVMAYQVNKDVDSFVTLVRAYVSSVDKRKTMIRSEEEEVEAEDLGVEKEEVVGRFVLTLARRKHPDIAKALTAFLDHGLAITHSCAQLAENALNQNLTEEIASLLAKLASNELATEPLKRQASENRTPIFKNEQALEQLKEKLAAKGETTEGVLRQMIFLQCWKKNMDAVLKTKAEMESNNFEITSPIYAQILDAYVNLEQLDDALKVLDEAKQKHSDFKMDKIKTVKLASLMIQKDRVDEAIELLKLNVHEEDKEMNYVLSSTCWRMLNSLAERKNVENVKEVLNVLKDNNYISINNVLLGSLIKVHILNDDLKGALDEFERCCELYRATPWKNELMCKLIQAEDANNLQRLTDLSTQIHGEVNSLYDLVMAFVECGRIRQARKILETPGLRTREDRINVACQKFRNEGLVAPLEHLVEVTKDLSHIDRSNIYYQLLLTYKKANDVDKALGLWTKTQEENVTVSDEFLATLGNFLLKNDKPVPFVIPKIAVAQQNAGSEEPVQRTLPGRPKSAHKNAFLSALEKDNVDKALDAKDKMESTGEELSRSHKSKLLEALLKSDRINEANRLVLSWLPQKPPLVSTLKYYTTRLSLTGDIETYEQFGKILDESLQKAVSFENKRVNCMLVAGKGKDELTKWMTAVDNVTEDEFDKLCAKFPRGGMLGLLNEYPECIPEYETMALKYNTKGFNGPLNTLFIHYFCNSEIDKAKVIYNKYLSNVSRLMYQGILSKARSEKKPEIIEELLTLLKGSPSLTAGVIGHIYSTLINIHCFDEKFDRASSQLETALKECSINDLNRNALLRLKAGLEANNQPFKYTIPEKSELKSKEESSSSSSSDDEKKPEKRKL